MKLLEYFDAIDDKDGKAKWMDFYRIGGNTENTNRWLNYMKDRDLISEFVNLDKGKEKKYYQKTERGSKLHNILKNRDLVAILTKELPKRKLRRAF
jgi:DNA-binding PadR family transcriptional regulator